MRTQALASSASAPNPYTVSVGKATSPPLRRISAARASASSVGWTIIQRSFEQIFSAVTVSASGLSPDQIRVDERVDIAVQYAIHVADRQLRPVILDHSVRRQYIAANLAAEVDLELRVFELLVLSLF